MKYDEYQNFIFKQKVEETEFYQYLPQLDVLGPYYFAPPSCLKDAYPNFPRMVTPGVALIGDVNSVPMQKVKSYLQALN